MAPTICLSELPVPGTAGSHCVHRKRRASTNSFVAKRQRLEQSGSDDSSSATGMPLTPPMSPTSNESSTRSVCATALPTGRQPPTRDSFPDRAEYVGLVLRTIDLARRNQILQIKVRMLRDETRGLLRSKQMREAEMEVEDDDSDASSELSLPLTPNSSCCSSMDDESSDWEDEM